jgi:phosphatidyl-myo-inositol alpha-mannosyltransferase
LKICLVSEYYYPVLGGITEHIHQFARQLLKQGHDVTLLTSNCGNIPESVALPGLNIVRIGRSCPVISNESFARVTLSPLLGTKVKRFFETKEFDVVHIHAAMMPMLPILAIRYKRFPTVGTIHTYFDRSKYLEIFQRRFQESLDRHDGIIAVSESCIEAMERYFDFESVIIPNGVDTEWFSSGRPLSHIRRDKFTIFYLGRLDPRNGLDTLIKAFEILRGRNIPAQLIVAGDGPLLNYYKALPSAQWKGDIHFVGAINRERPDYFASVDAFCYPATKASFGITLLESMSAGVPVVASRIRGFKEIVRDQVDGLLTPESNPESLANAFERLASDRNLRIRMGEHGRRRAAEFSWERVSQLVLDYYSSLNSSQATRLRAV